MDPLEIILSTYAQARTDRTQRDLSKLAENALNHRLGISLQAEAAAQSNRQAFERDMEGRRLEFQAALHEDTQSEVAQQAQYDRANQINRQHIVNIPQMERLRHDIHEWNEMEWQRELAKLLANLEVSASINRYATRKSEIEQEERVRKTQYVAEQGAREADNEDFYGIPLKYIPGGRSAWRLGQMLGNRDKLKRIESRIGTPEEHVDDQRNARALSVAIDNIGLETQANETFLGGSLANTPFLRLLTPQYHVRAALRKNKPYIQRHTAYSPEPTNIEGGVALRNMLLENPNMAARFYQRMSPLDTRSAKESYIQQSAGPFGFNNPSLLDYLIDDQASSANISLLENWQQTYGQ